MFRLFSFKTPSEGLAWTPFLGAVLGHPSQHFDPLHGRVTNIRVSIRVITGVNICKPGDPDQHDEMHEMLIALEHVNLGSGLHRGPSIGAEPGENM